MGWVSCQEDNLDARGERAKRTRASRYTKPKDKRVKRENLNVRNERAERVSISRFAQPKHKAFKLPTKTSRRKPRRRKRIRNARQLQIQFPV